MTECNARTNRPLREQLRSDDFAAFVRYAVVGVGQNAFFYGLMLAAVSVNFRAWQAILIVYPIAVASSFVANRLWSFAGRKRTPREFQKYLLVYAIVYPAAVVLTLVQEQAGVPSWLASLITLSAAAIGIFLALKYWVFGKGIDAQGRSSPAS